MNHSTIWIATANEKADLCTPCGGKCCQQTPGNFLPKDIDQALNPETLKSKIREMLKSGRYALDTYVGNPFREIENARDLDSTYYLRPALQGSEGYWFDDSWGGACTFHSDKGCALTETARPSGCRALVPQPKQQCSLPEGWEGNKTAAKAWWPFQELFKSLRKEWYEAD